MSKQQPIDSLKDAVSQLTILDRESDDVVALALVLEDIVLPLQELLAHGYGSLHLEVRHQHLSLVTISKSSQPFKQKQKWAGRE